MKYVVVISALWHDGKRYARGDILESDKDYGTRVEPYIEPPAPKPKPKRKKVAADEDI